MDVFIARQPVFDRHKQLYAYEVLYRSSQHNAYPEEVDGDDATHTVLAHVLFDIGLDAITGPHKAMINTTAFHLHQQTPAQLPPDRAIVELQPSVFPTQENLDACQDLVARGYTLALDNFSFGSHAEHFLPFAQIVKVDFQSIVPNAFLTHMARLQQDRPKAWLAQKIETHQEFAAAMVLGFQFFQGTFLEKPEVLRAKALTSAKMARLSLLAEVCRPLINFKTIERCITPDVSLSYKLLRYINSAAFSLLPEVNSVHHALTYLGEKGIRQFVALVATAELTAGKPPELLRRSMLRARYCQLLGEQGADADLADSLFLVGLFSMLDAMLDQPMQQITAQLPLADELRQALDQRRGPLAPYLRVAIAHEQGAFELCATLLFELGYKPATAINAFCAAVDWVEQNRMDLQ